MGKRISIKNSMRSLKRLIAKLPEGSEKRVKLERSLAELANRRQGVKRVEKEKKNAKRFRGIRFVERVKLTRKLKQLERDLGAVEAAGGKRKKMEEDIDKVKRDLLYIKHFPNSEKYISILLPTTEESAGHIQRIRDEIENKLREEAIVADADEGASLKGKQSTSSLSQSRGRPGSAGGVDVDQAEAEQDDFFLEDGEEGGELPTTTGVVSFELESHSEEEEDQEEGGDRLEREEGGEAFASASGHLRKRHQHHQSSRPHQGRGAARTEHNSRRQNSKLRNALSSSDFSPKTRRFSSGGDGGRDRSKTSQQHKSPASSRAKSTGQEANRDGGNKAALASPAGDSKTTPQRSRADGGRKRRRKK